MSAIGHGEVAGAVLERVVGQPEAVRLLRGSLQAPLHAYLFLGPAGTGRRDAAVAFAAALVCPDGGCGTCVSCVEALAGRHPDVEVIEPAGASILVDQAREVTRAALRSPRASRFHVLVLTEFDLADEAVPALLKTIEEPPDSTVIIVLAETVPRSLATIASRCVTVAFKALRRAEIIEVLRSEGTPPELAASAADASGGRLDRARLLAGDPDLGERLQRWRSVPGRLDGTGATVVMLADELLESVGEAVEVVRARQDEEMSRALAESEKRGERALPGRAEIEARHKRELRRARADELRAGLDVLLSVYRERLGGPLTTPRLRTTLQAMAVVDEAASRLGRNVNETMLLQWLLLRIDT